MSDLPKDWEMYAGIAFHAFIVKGEIANSENTRANAIEAGIAMARAMEKKDDEQYPSGN